jgi:hypothetical protein
VVNARVIDGLNGGIGVGICRQKNAFSFGITMNGLADELDAAHLRHALIGEEESRRFVAPF